LTRAKIEARIRRLLVSLAVSGMIVALAPWAASASSNPKANTFNFTGALVGSLKITPNDCEGGVASSNGADFGDVVGKLKGSKADDWNIMIVTPKGDGTYKLHHGHLAGVQVNPEPIRPPWWSWGNATGTLTVMGSTGNINAELSNANAGGSVPGAVPVGNIHIVGSWNCPGVESQ
jgi:hypothetical protein